MEKWKLLDSKYIVKRPWATLRVDKLQMPNGHIKEEYYVLEYPTWVNMIGFTTDQQILFVKQYRHGAAKVLVELPAGVVEPGEEPADGARREMLEETGYAFQSIEKICELYANPATSDNLTHTYLLKGGVRIQEQNLDDSEDIEVITLNVEQARDLLLSNKIGQSLHSAALFYTFQKLGLL